MRATASARRPSPLAALAGFLLEPLESAADEPSCASTTLDRPVVAVAGLAPRSGTTTVARALAAELALRDPDGAAVVSAEPVGGGAIPLGTPAAGRLARALSRASAARTRAVGRVCLAARGTDEPAALVDAVRELAPLVLDVADPAEISIAASLADVVVLVGVPDTEPALADVLSDSLSRVGPEPLVALNRDRGESEHWRERCDAQLPESRVGAQLALAGREPRGELGRSIARLADLTAGVP